MTTLAQGEPKGRRARRSSFRRSYRLERIRERLEEIREIDRTWLGRYEPEDDEVMQAEKDRFLGRRIEGVSGMIEECRRIERIRLGRDE